METTGINKTVYRSDVISALDSFTSVRNVLAWEMFQDGQVRNYDGVIGDLQRLYPDIDFDSVTENINPESIAADEDAIYALVDNIINKLIESGIPKDNFNYAIWACYDPENVADTYGVDIDDVSAYKITDGILLQDLGYEGQLYGVAEYPEEWDVIESALKGGNMKTREDYKDYYLEQLTEQFGDMTEADYNSAKKFCYDEEWNLGEVGNMAEAIDGLGDAWTEYQKQYKEGFEIMNNKNITSALDYDKIYYSIIETANPYDRTDQWELEKYQSEDRALRKRYPKDEFVKYIDYAAEQMSGDVEQITKYLKQIGVPNPHGQNGYIAMYTFNNLTGREHSTRFEDWMNAVRWKDIGIEEMAQEIYNAIHNIKSSKQSIKSSKAEELEMFNEESKYGNRSEFEDFKRNHPESTITYLDWRKYLNGYEDDVEYEYEDENGRMYTWDMIKKDIDDWVKNGDFKEYVDDALPDYIEPDGTPKYEKIYDDFWDIGSNGSIEYIGSSRRNNMIKSGLTAFDRAIEKKYNGTSPNGAGQYYLDWKYNLADEKDYIEQLADENGLSVEFQTDEGYFEVFSSRRNNMKTPIKSGYTGTNVSVEYGPYGEEKEFPFYDMKGKTVEQIDESIGYYDEVKTAWGSDGESYMILQDRANSEDKIAVLEDDYNEWVEAMSNEDYSKLLGNSRKAIKSANGSWEYQSDDMDEIEEKIGDIGISFTEPLLLADDGTLYTRAGFDQWLKYLEREEGDNWPDAYESYHRDTDEEFIEMCQDDFFQHDFGYTLTIYPEGLKSIAESVAEEIPSNEAPFAIPSGFAFNLYGEQEEPSGFNSYWIDDMSLDSESFIWGINPEFGNRFDVVIDPDYLWNGTENIQSSKKGEKKMKIQSKRLIKSGTSNFGSNDNVYGYDFPLVTYVAENYVYDEENDVDTDERDYDLDSLEYRDEIDNATDLAAEMDIPLYDDYRDPDYAPPFCIKFRDGYYEGIWIEIKEGGNTEDLSDAEFDNFATKINTYLDTLVKDYGWQKLGVTARFSNGETMYHKIDNSRKSVTSGLTFRQAVQDFKAAGQWNDYYEMQQDWEAYKDGLERDGVISEKTRSTWGNPCTPEGFKKWNK